jgi:hypothetical protein
MAFPSVPESSSYLPGVFFLLPSILDAEVVDARDNSWRGSFMTWLYLADMPSDVGVTLTG